MHKTLIYGGIAMLTLHVGMLAASADDAPFLSSAAARSLRDGPGRTSASVFERLAGDATVAANSLLPHFAANGARTALRSDADGGLHASVAGWSLDVCADGTCAHGNRQLDFSWASNQRPQLAELEALGRSFVASQLADVISLKTGEGLVALRTQYLVRGGQSDTGKMDPDAIVASRISFGRTIDGVRVVGGGSTISVTFAPDKTPYEFDYDWPQYRETKRVAVLARGPALQRLAAGAGGLLNRSLDTTKLAPTSTFPATLSAGVDLTRFECGYYDRGRMNEGSAVVQAGCLYELVESRPVQGGVTRAGHVGAVPVTTSIERDDLWREAVLLEGRATAATPPPNAPGVP